MGAREQTRRKVEAALEYLAGLGKRISPKTIADHAGISRATIYNDPDLQRLVQQYEANCSYARGYAAGLREGRVMSHSIRSRVSEEDWARGVMHINPDEKLTKSLVRRKLAQLSHLCHPDKGGHNDLQRVLNRAYIILKDATKS